MEGQREESGRREEEGARTVEEQRHVIRVGLGGGVGLHRAPLQPLLLLLLGRLGKLLGCLRLGAGEAHLTAQSSLPSVAAPVDPTTFALSTSGRCQRWSAGVRRCLGP